MNASAGRLPPVLEAHEGGLPIGVELGAIGVPFAWWRDSAQRLEEAGYTSVWCWDHFTSRGREPKSVLECWTTLAATASVTRRVALGSLVINVMNRHPALLARMATTLHEASAGRLVLGIGIGGHPAEHEAYGIAFPDVPERVARLEEAVAVLRALWTGGPVTRESDFYPLREAVALPVSDPAPSILIGAQSPAGARLAARLGDGWTTPPEDLDRLRPAYEAELEAAGRQRDDTFVLVAWEGGRSGEDALRDSPWVRAPRDELAEWQDRGADGVIVEARTTADVDALVRAAAGW